MKKRTVFSPRIDELARQAGEEHSLYLGEAIGNALAIAWEGFASLGNWARAVTRRLRTRSA